MLRAARPAGSVPRGLAFRVWTLERVLVINPGATSTKIAVFDGDKALLQRSIEHATEELARFGLVLDQLSYRLNLILSALDEASIPLSHLSAIVGRGGLLRPMESGTYAVNELMLDDLGAAARGQHASNLGPVMAHRIARRLGIPAYTVDPVAVDELDDVAKVSGLPELPRESLSHALNSKAVARMAAGRIGKRYERASLVVAHLGTGVSVSAHRCGRMIDVNNSQEEGPFSPDRCGTLPSYRLVKLCFSGRYSEKELLSRLMGSGGLFALIGTKDVRTAEARAAAGDADADLALRALAYQTAKEIGAMAAVLHGEVDCIALTGGMAHSGGIVEDISTRVRFIAPVLLFPGEEEMVSLALGALRALRGEEEVKTYGRNAQC